MKFLTDENIGLAVIEPLRNLGFDVQSVLETETGISDIKVLFLANKGNRILITSDKDFGELVYVQKLIHKGVILLRLRDESSANKFKILKILIEKHKRELEKSFTVVTDTRIRIVKPKSI